VVPLDVQVSDRILFGKYSGSDIKLDGEEYLIMREDEVLGIPDAKSEVANALSHSHDLALLGLIFGAVGDVQATLQLLLLLNSFDHNPVIERPNLRGMPPLMKN
jgi:hypothetical protein